ncbi:uncharacterized protein B0I36DRAFT_412202 [Microdochium trichocladiopsis]|uniref:ABM domain-containing protein n=1 Tax=Microdochium trichocladiopsis TaxID=1682393 RepID=A0A9P8Y6A0_9PEZI|nr:uncharacterized protein B0I36DRAFT_412202 [Microdochium trichocladiopsis]KAH7029850.1 hypothetical protein B0I36DRAFT_412202 [Microdochium trichocladiopsis]
MTRKLVVARMPMASTEAKETFIKFLSDASDYALENEPGIKKYAICLPRDEPDSNVVYAVEEYQDEATFDSHMATDGVKRMMSWISSGSRFDGTPEINQLAMIDGFHFSRPQVNSAKDPHVLFADLSYHPAGVVKALPYWQAVVDTGRNDEPGTWVYAVNKDPTNENRICVLETYETPEYLTEVHVPSHAIQESIKNTKDLRTGLKHTKLKLVKGFLHRD